MDFRKSIITILFAFSACAFMPATQASVIYEWVCDTTDCNGDPLFSSTLEISDTAFAAGSFTGVSGNVLAWDTSSGVGDGYTLSLSDIDSSLNDDINLFMALNADGSEISDLLDLSSGTNITFFNASQGRVDFFEGTGGNYSAGSLIDLNPNSGFANIIIAGHFIRVSSVPEPSALVLLGLGLLVLSATRRGIRA